MPFILKDTLTVTLEKGLEITLSKKLTVKQKAQLNALLLKGSKLDDEEKTAIFYQESMEMFTALFDSWNAEDEEGNKVEGSVENLELALDLVDIITLITELLGLGEMTEKAKKKLEADLQKTES